jgi:hypothetical protein
MLEVKPAEITVEQDQHDVNNAKKNKKLLLWAILIVLVLLVLYVLFGENNKKYRLVTETRNDLVNKAVSNPLLSETSSNTVGPMTTFSSTSPNTPTSSSASAVRRELANLFKSYA